MSIENCYRQNVCRKLFLKKSQRNLVIRKMSVENCYRKKISIENCDQQNVHRNLLSKKCVLKFVSEKMSIEICYRKNVYRNFFRKLLAMKVASLG